MLHPPPAPVSESRYTYGLVLLMLPSVNAILLQEDDMTTSMVSSLLSVTQSIDMQMMLFQYPQELDLERIGTRDSGDKEITVRHGLADFLTALDGISAVLSGTGSTFFGGQSLAPYVSRPTKAASFLEIELTFN